MPKIKTTTILLRASDYEDYDDSLSAAEMDVAEDYGIEEWEVVAEWADDSREQIRVTIPADA